MTELIYLVLQGGLYTCIVYFMAGFQKDAGKFFWVGFLSLRLNSFTAHSCSALDTSCVSVNPKP